MERRRGKHILYSICFICFAIMDWCRGSQNWMTWSTAINLTGAVLAIIMISHFRWKEEPKKPYLIWLGLWLTGSVAGCIIWFVSPFMRFLSQYWAVAVSVAAVGIVAIRVWRERKQLQVKVSGRSILTVSFIVMSVFMSVSRLGEIWPTWYLVIFGLFYLIPFSKEERRELWVGMADGLIAVFFILQIVAYGFKPYDEVRYKGLYANCNMNALFYLITYVALLFRSHFLRWQEQREGVAITWKRKLAKAFLWVLTAGIWGFILLTMTRTAMIMLVVISLLYGMIEFVVIFREKLWQTFLRGVALLLGALVLFPVVYLTIRWLPTILHHPIWFGDEYSVDKVHSYDPADSEKYISFDEVLEELLGRYNVTLSQSQEAPEILDVEFPMLAAAELSAEMMAVSDEDVSQTEEAQEYLLSGDDALDSGKIRFEIWKLYLENLNLRGHELEEGYFQITAGYHAWHAQNVFIQIAFYYGIIAGVLLIVLTAGVGIYAVKLAVSKRRCEDILPLFIGLLFVGYGMLECVWYPGQTILLLIYMIPKIIVDDKRDLQEDKLKLV